MAKHWSDLSNFSLRYSVVVVVVVVCVCVCVCVCACACVIDFLCLKIIYIFLY